MDLVDSHMLRIHSRIVKSAYKIFGLKAGLGTLAILPLSAGSNFLIKLDDIFYPGYKGINIKNPVFIIGNPRSGTTFFHRLLTQCDDFVCFKTWELAVPSLTARFAVRPFIRKISDRVSKQMFKTGEVYPDGSHKITFDSVEEEELLFTHRMDTFFINKTPIAFDDQENWDLHRIDDQPWEHRKSSAEFLQGCLKRQIYQTGKDQILAKMPYSTMRIKTLLEIFPDAKFIYLVRNPIDSIVSHLTQHRQFFDSRWGLEKIPKQEIDKYMRRRYEYNVDMYRYFYELHHIRHELPKEQILEVKYERFIQDLENAFEEVIRFIGAPISDDLRNKVQAQARKQKAYKAGHKKLDLSAFNLTEEMIEKDLDFLFTQYNFPRPSEKRNLNSSHDHNTSN